jgi:hypothetical protein
VLLAECQSPHTGGGEASGTAVSMGGGLRGGVGWQPVVAVAVSWAGDGVEGRGQRGMEESSGP